MKKTYIWHSDGGHAWLAVKKQELIDLGIETKISPYSYRKGNTIYLEEDCDATVFCDTMEKQGFTLEFTEKDHGDYAPLRGYSRYVNRAYRSPFSLVQP